MICAQEQEPVVILTIIINTLKVKERKGMLWVSEVDERIQKDVQSAIYLYM